MADEKLIFEIGFDLDGAVQVAIKDGKKAITKIQKELGKTPIQLDVDTKSLRAELKKLNDEWNKLSASQRAGVEGTKLREQYRALTLEANGYTSTLRSAVSTEDKATAAKQRATKATERQTNAYKTQSSYLSRLVQRMVAYASVAQAFSFIRNIREVTAQFELQRVALGSIIGDLNEANAMFEQIKAAAVKSPFQIKELVTYTKQLAAYKIESDELFETTQRLADVSAGLGVGMERLVLAYGQIRATGYLRASEVRQLTEAGIPIVEELAKKMSDLRGETVSAAKVMGMISERAISFGMVKEVFDDMTSAGGMFYKMQEKQAETLAGQWSNLQDAISIMYDEIGNTERVNNAMKGMIGLIKSLAENWRTIATVVNSVGLQFAAFQAYDIFIRKIAVDTTKVAQAEERLLVAQNARAAAEQRGARVTAFFARSTERAAHATLAAANATTKWGKAWNSMKAFLMGNWIGLLLSALAMIGTYLYSSYKEAKRLNEELEKIGTEGALQADQSVRNFERLARAIRESADGSAKQTEALKEMKRAYGDFLPSQDKSIINLVREKDGYNAVTQAIREKIALQIQEQKLNKVTSEYGGILGDYQGKVRENLEKDGWQRDIISAIFRTIENEVKEGTLDISNVAQRLPEIFKQITGESLNYLQILTKSGSNFWGTPYLLEYIRNLNIYEDKLKDIISESEESVGVFGKYTQAYKVFKEELKDVTGTGEKFSFEWNESKTKAEIKAYNEFIGNLLAKEGIKFDIDEAIDFKGLYEALGDNYPQLKQVVAKIQGEYEKLVPKDLEKLIKEQFSTLATKYGASLDKLQHYFKSADESTQDWVKTLKDAKTDIGNQIFDAKKLDKDTTALEAQKQVIEEMITAWDNSEKTQKAGAKSAEQPLKDELVAVEKIYKRYQDLRKLKSETDTQSILANEFKGVSLTTLSKAYSPTQMIEVYQKALAEAQRLGKKDLVLEIQTKIGEFNVDNEQRELEKKLKDLSDRISRTKTAKEFFDRMLGMTGDKEFSASLTLSVYGEGGDLGKKLAEQTIEEAELAFAGLDISKAIDKNTGSINYALLRTMLPALEDISEKQAETAEKFVSNGEKANADWLTDLQKTYEKAFTFEERRTQVMQEEAQKRKEIEESKSLTPEQKAKFKKASEQSEARQITAINLEEFKASEDYIKMFEDFDRLATPTVERLIAKLREFIATNKELNATDLKNLTEQINKLEEGLIKRNPFEGLTKGIERVRQARQKLSASSFKDEKEYTDALDEQEAGYDDIEQALKGIQNEFSKAEQTIRGFAEALGIAEDSDMGVFLNGIADAFGYVQKAIVFADLAMKLFDGTIKTFLASNPIGWIALIAGGVMGAISAIANAKVRKANKEIERQQDLIDKLEKSHERLEKQIEKTFGSDYLKNYNDRLANLYAQQEAYLKQAEAERSKGKKEDEEKTQGYLDSASDVAEQIADMQKEVSERFLGTDLASAARDFAQSWIDAYKEFGSTTDAMKEKFHDMIQNMVVESIAGRMMQQLLQPVFDAIDDYSKDGQLDEREIADIADMSIGLIDAMDEGMTGIVERLRAAGYDIRQSTSGLTGISKDIASASEESILGLAAGINTQNFYISQVPPKLDTIIALLQGGGVQVGGSVNMQDLITIQNQHLSHLPNIAQNTAETVAECKMIVAETRRTADALERVIKPRGTQATHTVNTSL